MRPETNVRDDWYYDDGFAEPEETYAWPGAQDIQDPIRVEQAACTVVWVPFYVEIPFFFFATSLEPADSVPASDSTLPPLHIHWAEPTDDDKET